MDNYIVLIMDYKLLHNTSLTSHEVTEYNLLTTTKKKKKKRKIAQEF